MARCETFNTRTGSNDPDYIGAAWIHDGPGPDAQIEAFYPQTARLTHYDHDFHSTLTYENREGALICVHLTPAIMRAIAARIAQQPEQPTPGYFPAPVVD